MFYFISVHSKVIFDKRETARGGGRRQREEEEELKEGERRGESERERDR